MLLLLQGRQAQLSAGWDRARSVLQELQTAGRLPNGVHAASFTRGDWHWAAGTLLSRAVALPLSETSQDETITSLVPGLDMANHSPARNCFWQVTGSLLDGSASIELKALRRLQAGEELCLTYGRDGNDALLFKYGFVDDNNPNDVCTLPCPLEHVDNSRLQSLQVRSRCWVVRPVPPSSMCSLSWQFAILLPLLYRVTKLMNALVPWLLLKSWCDQLYCCKCRRQGSCQAYLCPGAGRVRTRCYLQTTKSFCEHCMQQEPGKRHCPRVLLPNRTLTQTDRLLRCGSLPMKFSFINSLPRCSGLSCQGLKRQKWGVERGRLQMMSVCCRMHI